MSKSDQGIAKDFEHNIELKDDAPIYLKQFSLLKVHRDLLEGQIKEWSNQVVHSTTCHYFWSNKNKCLHVVQDFGKLNARSHNENYSMEDINECISDFACSGFTIFNTLNFT
jgi:hypothetical protein